MYDVDFNGHVMPPPDAVAGTAKGPDGKRVKVCAVWTRTGSNCRGGSTSAAPSTGARIRRPLDEGRPTLSLTYPQPGVNSAFDRVVVGMHDYGSGLDMASW